MKRKIQNENNETDFGLLTVYGYKSLLMLRNSYFDLNENELRLFGRRLLYSARHTKMPMTMIEIIMSQVQSFHIRNSSQRSSHTQIVMAKTHTAIWCWRAGYIRWRQLDFFGLVRLRFVFDADRVVLIESVNWCCNDSPTTQTKSPWYWDRLVSAMHLA